MESQVFTRWHFDNGTPFTINNGREVYRYQKPRNYGLKGEIYRKNMHDLPVHIAHVTKITDHSFQYTAFVLTQTVKGMVPFNQCQIAFPHL